LASKVTIDNSIPGCGEGNFCLCIILLFIQSTYHSLTLYFIITKKSP
jgi:hypothetical protein